METNQKNVSPIPGLGQGNFQYKLCDFTQADTVGVVNIEPIRKQKHNEPDASFFNYKDTVNRIIYGLPQGINNITGEIVGPWQKINLSGPMSFDLKRNEEAVLWFLIKTCPYMKDSPFPLPGITSRFEWYIPEDRAKKKLGVFQMKMECFNFLSKLDDETHEQFALAIIGVVANMQSREVSLQQIMDMAEYNVYDVYKKIKDRDRTAMLAVLRNMEAATVVTTLGGKGYRTLDGNSIGMNEEQAVNFLMQNQVLAQQWNNQARQMLKLADRFSSRVNTTTAAPESVISGTNVVTNTPAEADVMEPVADQMTKIEELTKLPAPKKVVAKA